MAITKENYIKIFKEKKMNLLDLAEHLKNVTKTCKIMKCSREHYYQVKSRYLLEGESGLTPKSRAPLKRPCQTPLEVENKVLAYILENPQMSYETLSGSLRLEKGINISEGRIRGIFERNGLNTFKKRLRYLEIEYQKQGFELSAEQVELLSRVTDKIKSEHLYAPYTGYLLSQDTFFVGYLKGVGRIYMQSVIDCSNSFAFGQLYTSKNAITSAHMLQNRVIPFYDKMGCPINHILTDNGTEYCGDDTHPYELLLWLLNIKHRRTKVKRPQTNGFVERFHQTVLKEFFMIKFRTTWFNNLQELQTELDKYLIKYNFYRPHKGYRLKGKTPFQKFSTNRQLAVSA